MPSARPSAPPTPPASLLHLQPSPMMMLEMPARMCSPGSLRTGHSASPFSLRTSAQFYSSLFRPQRPDRPRRSLLLRQLSHTSVQGLMTS